MWEWRIFGSPARVPLPANPEDGSVEREDLYLLGHGDDHGLKLRGSAPQRLELKLGHERLATGHERWEKVFDARLPLSPEALARLFSLLGRPAPTETRTLLTVEDVTAALPWLVPVRVTKRVARSIAPARGVESTVLSIGGAPFHSLAVEAETAEECLALGRAAGLPLRGEAPEGVIVAGYPEAVALLRP
jgi:hypothetical protein